MKKNFKYLVIKLLIIFTFLLTNIKGFEFKPIGYIEDPITFTGGFITSLVYKFIRKKRLLNQIEIL